MRSQNLAVSFPSSSMAASITSAAIPLYAFKGWGAQCVYTGSPNGTLKAQISCDPDPIGTSQGPLPVNWDDLADSTFTIAAAGSCTWNFHGAEYSWIRFVFTRSSGTGTISGRVNLKGSQP